MRTSACDEKDSRPLGALLHAKAAATRSVSHLTFRCALNAKSLHLNAVLCRHLTRRDSFSFLCLLSELLPSPSQQSEERNIQLIVQGAPEPPFNVKASDIKSRGLTLSWSEPNNGNSPLLGFLVQFTRSNGMRRDVPLTEMCDAHVMFCSCSTFAFLLFRTSV